MFTNTILQHQQEAEVQHQQEAEELKWHTQDQDVNILAYKLDLLAYCFGTLNLFLSYPQAKPDGKPKPKKVKVILAYANLKPGSEAVLLLLGQINAALKAVQLADDGTHLPCTNLQQHHDAVHLAVQQQLYLLNIALQTYKLILACLIHLNKTLGLSNVKHTGDLLNDLQVLPEVINSDSDVKIAPSSLKIPHPPILVQEAPTVTTRPLDPRTLSSNPPIPQNPRRSAKLPPMPR
ncbi:hypothetical protein C0989_005643 [Termitomyces sp. Mn162]|nr:hypothetical protein C0989_005643 [Termitomyces sp. Mn162]